MSGKPSSWRDPEQRQNDQLTKLLHNGYATEEEKASKSGVKVRKRYSLGKLMLIVTGFLP